MRFTDLASLNLGWLFSSKDVDNKMANSVDSGVQFVEAFGSVKITSTPLNHKKKMLFFYIKSIIAFIMQRVSYEPRCEKPAFCICENKHADQLRSISLHS